MRTPCRKIRQRLSEFLDGDLSPEACGHLQRHLAECAGCAAVMNALRKTVNLCRRLRHEPVPPDIRQALRALLHDHLGGGRAKAHRRRRG